MASTIKIKRSGVANKTPTTADIATGELAINYKDQKLFSSNGTAVFQIGASSGGGGGLVSITTASIKNLTQNDTVVTSVSAVTSNNYLEVANAVSTYLTKNNPVITGTLTANGSTGTSGYYLRTSGTGVYWSPASSTGGGATGGGSDKVFYENDITITTNYTITTNKNAMSAGPVTINSGVTVTVPSGSVWSII